MHERIPLILHPLLQDFSHQIDRELSGFITAFYIVGSIALDEFNPQFSDIDFVAILSRKVTPGDLECMRNIHRAIEQQYPRWKMEGCYLQPGDLGHFEVEVEPFPSYHDGVLRLSRHFELNSITWWILKNNGIAFVGPEPSELPFSVDWNVLITRMRENLNSYWASWTKRPVRIILLLSDWGIQWAVLGVLRQFYTFRENQITTKKRAGEYALSCAPAHWRRLIQETINLRDGSRQSLYRSRVIRAIDAVRFLRYVIQTASAPVCRPVAKCPERLD
ncbi:MAG: DUF4111 domain-containing protein [Chloroflexi bacterium]|nr:DUF4111 domain-containing protein [Chloroflexota bacterium]